MILGLMMGKMATDSFYDDEMIRNIMEHYYIIIREHRELEFSSLSGGKNYFKTHFCTSYVNANSL